MISIRPYQLHDFTALVNLYQDFFNFHHELIGSSQITDETQAQEITLETLSQANSWIIVAEESQAQRVIGFARWEEREGAFFGREIYVLPDFRQQGIGAQLQAEVEQQVKQAGGDAIFISIVPQNQNMLIIALQLGYDTLNTVELRKDLAGHAAHRKQITYNDLNFNVL